MIQITLLACLPMLAGALEFSLPAATPASRPAAVALPAVDLSAFFDQGKGAPSLPDMIMALPSRKVGTPAAVPAAQDDAPFFASDLWASLSAPDAAALDWLAQRIPRLPRANVRELPFDAADAVMARAAASKTAALDLFTDPGLKTRGQLFYLSTDTLKKIFAKYNLRILSPLAGKAKDGGRFQVEAILMGSGRLELLYDRDEFKFDNADYKGHTYKAVGRVTETIKGPGDLAVEGIWVDMFVHPKIERFTKLDDKTLRVETSWGGEDRPLLPILKK